MVSLLSISHWIEMLRFKNLISRNRQRLRGSGRRVEDPMLNFMKPHRRGTSEAGKGVSALHSRVAGEPTEVPVDLPAAGSSPVGRDAPGIAPERRPEAWVRESTAPPCWARASFPKRTCPCACDPPGNTTPGEKGRQDDGRQWAAGSQHGAGSPGPATWVGCCLGGV